jgi:hypothetical protein
MGLWKSSAGFDGDPRRLISALTDVETIRRWAPVPFNVDGSGAVLQVGDDLEVSGGLLNCRVHFDVHVDRADLQGLSLRARGAFDIDVHYRIDMDAGRVDATVRTAAKGPLPRLLASAANALLSAGVLDRVLAAIVCAAGEAEYELA